MTITNPAHIGKCWCGEKPTSDSVGDWDSADHYLRHGKSPHSRPLCNNTRILRLWDGDIGVRLHSTMVVVYPRPGWKYAYPHHVAWFTLGGHNTITTRNRVTRFTPALVASNSHTPWPYLVHSEGLPRTPLNSNETVAVDKWGKMVASAHDYPMDVYPHELAESKVKVVPKPDWHKNHYGPHTKPPAPEPQSSPPNVDGDKVIAAMGSVVPDIGRTVRCPAGCTTGSKNGGSDTPYTKSLSDMIIHLNDTHKWSREGIADWLESLDLDLEFRKEAS